MEATTSVEKHLCLQLLLVFLLLPLNEKVVVALIAIYQVKKHYSAARLGTLRALPTKQKINVKFVNNPV